MRDLIALLRLFDSSVRWRFGGIFLLMVVSATLDLVGVGLFLPLLYAVLDPEKLTRSPVGPLIPADASPEAVALGFTGLLVGFFLVKGVAMGVIHLTQHRFILGQQSRMKSRLLAHYLGQPFAFHLRHNSAELIRNISDTVVRIFHEGLLPLATVGLEVLFLGGTVLLLLSIEPKATMILAGLAAGVAVPFYLLLGRRMTTWGNILHRNYALSLQWLSQGLDSIKETKVLGRSGYFVERFAQVDAATARTIANRSTAERLPSVFMELILAAALALVLALLTGSGMALKEALVVLGMYGIAGMRMIPSANRLVVNALTMRHCAVSIRALGDDIRAALAEANPLAERGDRRLPLNSALAVDNVTLRYEDGKRPAVDGLSLTIRRGEWVALVGSSGAGKSTLADMILGLHRPDGGCVTADGVDIFGDLAAWQNGLGYVPQSICLLDDSIRRNVALGLPDARIDDDRVWESLRLARLDDFVRTLPEGLGTVTGENGSRLSGGQRQRIGIARALYHNPDLLVLDEATSALDSETEREIADTLEGLRGDKTVIIIAHRLASVTRCDRLFFLDHGRLTAAGSFNELCRNSGQFAAFVQSAGLAAVQE